MPRRTGRTHGFSASAMRSAERIERLVVELFRAHWRAVVADLSKGVDMAKNYEDCFFASSQRKRLRMARRYYAPARAVKLLKLRSTRFCTFQTHGLPRFATTPNATIGGSTLRKELRQLVAAEYVAVSSDLPDSFGLIRQEGTTVYALPTEGVLYDDVYEITASGVSSGARLWICKSVAEPFDRSERCETMVGIENDFFANAVSDGEPKGAWEINFRRLWGPAIDRGGY